MAGSKCPLWVEGRHSLPREHKAGEIGFALLGYGDRSSALSAAREDKRVGKTRSSL